MEEKKIKIGPYWHYLKKVDRSEYQQKDPAYMGIEGYALSRIEKIKPIEYYL